MKKFLAFLFAALLAGTSRAGVTTTHPAGSTETYLSGSTLNLNGTVSFNGSPLGTAAFTAASAYLPSGTVLPQTRALTANQFLTSYDASTGMFAAATVTVPTVATTTSVLKGNGSGGAIAATAGTDFLAPAAIGATVQAYSATIPTAYLGTTSTTALAGNTALLQLGTTGTTALAGNTVLPANTTATTGQFFSAYNSATGAFTKTAVTVPTVASTAGILKGDGAGNAVAATANTDYAPGTGSTVYAPLASPALTGTPTVPTATAGANTTQAASTAFTTGAISTAQALDLLKANNLSDVASAATSRANLGAAASGANGDITSLTSLGSGSTTAPSIAIGASNTGIYSAGGQLAFVQTGTLRGYFNGSGLLYLTTGFINNGTTQSGANGTTYKAIRFLSGTLSGGTVTIADTVGTSTTKYYPAAQDNNTLGAIRKTGQTVGTSVTFSASSGDSGLISVLAVDF